MNGGERSRPPASISRPARSSILAAIRATLPSSTPTSRISSPSRAPRRINPYTRALPSPLDLRLPCHRSQRTFRRENSQQRGRGVDLVEGKVRPQLVGYGLAPC